MSHNKDSSKQDSKPNIPKPEEGYFLHLAIQEVDNGFVVQVSWIPSNVLLPPVPNMTLVMHSTKEIHDTIETIFKRDDKCQYAM
jgi:hypothetical protein